MAKSLSFENMARFLAARSPAVPSEEECTRGADAYMKWKTLQLEEDKDKDETAPQSIITFAALIQCGCLKVDPEKPQEGFQFTDIGILLVLALMSHLQELFQKWVAIDGDPEGTQEVEDEELDSHLAPPKIH